LRNLEENSRLMEEKRKKAVEDWMQNKVEQERQRKRAEQEKQEADRAKHLKELEDGRVRRVRERVRKESEAK